MLELDNWYNTIVKKSAKRNKNVDFDSAVNDLKLLAYDTIVDFMKKLNCTTKRQYSNALSNLEKVFTESKRIFIDMTKDKELELTLGAFNFVLKEILDDLKLTLYSSKDFNIFKYIQRQKAKLSGKCAKLTNDIGISFDLVDDNQEDEDEDLSGDTEEEENDEDYEEYIDSDMKDNDKLVIKDFHNEINNSNKKKNLDDVMTYFSNLDSSYKNKLIERFKQINNFNNTEEPHLIRILNMNTNLAVKKTLIDKLNQCNSGFGEKSKAHGWFENAMKIPFGTYKGVNIRKIGKSKKRVTKFLESLKKQLDGAIYGHNKAKEQVVMMMAQMIRNPDCKGNVFGLYGPPGNGKTTIIKEGIAKAMKKPFVFISLGGATDASYLEGHSYTYEGSICGRIVQGLIDSKCMDPIIYFDELDKVSQTHKGEEIINLLIHMIDPSQNTHFKDKYFYDLDIDLSKVTFIFSFNDPSRVNNILMDRITSIETKYLTTEQKVIIGRDYLRPAILKDIGLKDDSIVFSDDVLEHIILKYTYEGGVRKLKQLIYEISRQINKYNLIGNKFSDNKVNFPYNVVLNDLEILLKDYRKINRDKIHKEPSIGMINGLWANSLGIGGVLPIESSFIPAKDFMGVKTTGSLKDVMKESIQVAYSVAWSFLSSDVKNKFMERWKDSPETFHIHCPDGAVPKDGPSAGAAMTTVMYSQFMGLKVNNKVAMTGEINLRGNVTAIGGLEEKLVGAKLAGVELALIPKENEEDLNKVIRRNPELVNDNFRVVMVSHFSEIPELVKYI
jgi:ATP-dependent Lon protease